MAFNIPINYDEFWHSDISDSTYFDDNKDFWLKVVKNRDIFKNPIRVFEKKNIEKLNYFHLTINIKIDWVHTGSFLEYDSLFFYDYFFCKTKGNKYLFKTKFKERNYSENQTDNSFIYDWTDKNFRYCYTKRFNDFFFNNTELKMKHLYDINENKNKNIWDDFYFREFNTVKILDKNDIIDFDLFFENNVLGDNMETIHLYHLDQENNLFENIKKNIKNWSKLKCFIVDNDCDLINSRLIELLRELSSLKSLFLIDISFKKRLELNQKQKKEMNELFPNLSIEINEKTSSLKWNYGKNKN